MEKKDHRLKIISFLVILTLTTTLMLPLIPRIPQPLSYHQFAEQRVFFSIPNFSDVVFNLFIIAVGIIGLLSINKLNQKQTFFLKQEKIAWILLFGGIFLTGIGSSYYHMEPNNLTLYWDRLPLGASVMILFCILIMERINPNVGFYLLFPFILISIFCTTQWEYSEQMGKGDLRLFSWSQIYPVIMILLLILLFSPIYTGQIYLFSMLFFYGLAKLTELLDKPIYQMTNFISGHTLKHLLAALSIFFLIKYLQNRRKINPRMTKLNN